MYSSGTVSMAGPPTNGVNAVQTVTETGGPTGGTFTLTFGGQTTTPLPYNCDAPTMQAALQALSSIGANNVLCSGGPLPGAGIVCTFQKALGGLPQATMTHTDSLTGGSTPAAAIAATTVGVRGSYRTAPRGWTLLDTTNSRIYQQTGPPEAPTWTEPVVT